jgi:hypothetical protein
MYEISKWLEKLRKSNKNSVKLADIPILNQAFPEYTSGSVYCVSHLA